MSKAESNCSIVQFTALRVLLIKNTVLSLISTTALFSSHHKSVETKDLRSKLLKEHANFSCDDTLALYSLLLTPALGCSSTQHYSNSMNTVVLQLSMCQAFTLSNNLDTVTGPLSQHTASTCTFEDTKTLRSILLLFCQQVLIEKHTSCSQSGLKMFSTANTVPLIH